MENGSDRGDWFGVGVDMDESGWKGELSKLEVAINYLSAHDFVYS